MKKTKAILMALCAVLLVAASVMGTLAYLTSTDTVTNTFTVGNVQIKLDEAKVDGNGKALADGTRWHPTDNDPKQEYHLLPGHTYDKDPTVTVLKGSDKSYVRMLVTVTFETPLDKTWVGTELDGIFTGYNASAWPREGAPKVNYNNDGKVTSIEYEYRYSAIVEGKKNGANADVELPDLFTNIVIPDTYTNEQIAALNGMKITVVAQAIQADGFNGDVDAAWRAFSAT